jgi:hypothetical protein
MAPMRLRSGHELSMPFRGMTGSLEVVVKQDCVQKPSNRV